CSDTAIQEIEVLKNKNLPPRLCDFEIRPNPVLQSSGSHSNQPTQPFFVLAQNNDKQVREIKIFNSLGELVYQTDVSHWKEDPFFWQSPSVNLSLASGTYLLGLYCESETVFKRLVVE
ncbi:MAG: T9SS type A sorting domain-containing protein, partial [Flavobacteriales bacterium]|nr:T9SS type A sorting domain-containing protein [Flavobacteriales bacterium]